MKNSLGIKTLSFLHLLTIFPAAIIIKNFGEGPQLLNLVIALGSIIAISTGVFFLKNIARIFLLFFDSIVLLAIIAGLPLGLKHIVPKAPGIFFVNFLVPLMFYSFLIYYFSRSNTKEHFK